MEARPSTTNQQQQNDCFSLDTSKDDLPINSILASFLQLAQNLTNKYQENEVQSNSTEKLIFEGNHSDKEYVCYESLEEYGPTILNIHYWMNGIGTIVIGSIGIIGNIITILVLQRIDTNVMFNRLLLTLEADSRLNAKPNFILLSIMVILNSCLKYGAFFILGLM